jgi:hypothetical protein
MDNPEKKTGNLGYTRRNIKQSKNIAHYVLDTTMRKINTNNTNNTTGVKYKSNIAFMWKS